MSNVKNYTEQGGERTVIGGELVIATGGKLLFGENEVSLEGIRGDKGETGDKGATGDKGPDGDIPTPAANQPASTASTIADLRTDFNTLLAALKVAGVVIDDE